MDSLERIALLQQKLKAVQDAMNEALDVGYGTWDINDLCVRETRYLRESVFDLTRINEHLISGLSSVQNRLSRIKNQENAG